MTFPARYPGKCAACGERITPGDLITVTDHGPLCEGCEEAPVQYRGAPEPIACPRCWLIHPDGGCDR